MHPLALLLGLLRLLVGGLAPGATPGLTALTALAAAGALVLLAGVLSGTPLLARLLGAASPHAVRDKAMRRRALSTAFLPQRDPDARGRSRPRAPGAAPTAV